VTSLQDAAAGHRMKDMDVDGSPLSGVPTHVLTDTMTYIGIFFSSGWQNVSWDTDALFRRLFLPHLSSSFRPFCSSLLFQSNARVIFSLHCMKLEMKNKRSLLV